MTTHHNGSRAMALLAEWESEARQTRKLLERVPEDKLEWKPHAKSMALGHLAQHLGYATDVFGPATIQHDVYAWSGKKQEEPDTVADILATFDKADHQLRELLKTVTDEQLAKTWTFGTVEKPFFQSTREGAIRAFLFSHLIHHRGQLSVYLRLLEVAVPGMYGPSADEK